MRIRPAHEFDLPAIYRICDAMSFQSGSSNRNPDLLGHVYAGPYVVGDATRPWVVVNDSGLVVGYLLTTSDTNRFALWREREWWPILRKDYPPDGSWSPGDREMVELIHSPMIVPDEIVCRFPAHFHIDLLPEAQGLGLATELINSFIEELASAGVPGVHLDVDARNDRAIRVYQRLGFTEILRINDSLIMAQQVLSAK